MFDFPIAISLSPNTQADDIWQTIKILFQPWSWKEGSQIRQVEEWFCNYFRVGGAFSFNSARSALYSLLKTFEIGEGDEVMIQAFTCVAVAEPIIWVGARPVFIEVDETLNLDYRLLEQKITNKTKAIIVQHTFGLPANIEKITKIAQKYKLLLIEDCAHSLGAEYKGRKLGSFGDAAFFSFGRDKVISSVFGGMAIINQKSKIKNQKSKKIQDKLRYPSYFWILQQLLHPIAFAIILPFYNLILGKVILFFLIKSGILSKPVYKEELGGGLPKIFPSQYPNALACLLLNQLRKLERYNAKRKQIAEYYYKNLHDQKNIVLPPKIPGSIYLRFNILIKNAKEVRDEAKKEKMILGNWYHKIIDPEGVRMEKIGYSKGSCPKAENYATLSCNLPTYPRLDEANVKRIVNFIKTYA